MPVKIVGMATPADFHLIENRVILWAIKHGIFANSDSKTQCLKTVSEVGELADNVAKGNDIRDDIGDIIVTLILLARMNDTDIQECLGIAYGEISQRTGKMMNGTFVKDGE